MPPLTCSELIAKYSVCLGIPGKVKLRIVANLISKFNMFHCDFLIMNKIIYSKVFIGFHVCFKSKASLNVRFFVLLSYVSQMDNSNS